MSKVDGVIFLILIGLIAFVSFNLGIDHAKETFCEKHGGVFLDGHCIRQDVLLFHGVK